MNPIAFDIFGEEGRHVKFFALQTWRADYMREQNANSQLAEEQHSLESRGPRRVNFERMRFTFIEGIETASSLESSALFDDVLKNSNTVRTLAH